MHSLSLHSLFSLLITLLGVLLLIYMIVVEDEPGAIPLLLIIIGSIWYIFTRRKFQSWQTISDYF